MSKAFVMTGLQGSGKSTVAAELAVKEKAKVFSSDTYRKNMYGSESVQEHNQEIFNALYRDMRAALIAGENIIFDATNYTMKDRARFFNQIKGIDNVEVIAIVVNVPVLVCIERDAARERTVGKEVIERYIKKFQCPQKFEGFSEIRFTENPILTPEEMLYPAYGYDQGNPHHINSLDMHCKCLASNYNADTVEHAAGLIHDVGKLRTRGEDNQGIAHFYDHDNVGAYLCITHLGRAFFASDDDYLKCICIVNYHMKFHKDWRTEKYKQLFGEDLYNTLVQFAEYDKEASGTESIHNDIIRMQKVDKLLYEEIIGSEIWQKCKKEHSYVVL